MSIDIDKLIKVLNLLSSTHEGEAAAAAHRASAMLRAAGLQWSDLIRAPGSNTFGAGLGGFGFDGFTNSTGTPWTNAWNPTPTRATRPRPTAMRRDKSNWRLVCLSLLAQTETRLSNWEREFLTSLHNKSASYKLSEQQDKKLDEVVNRVWGGVP